MPDSADHRIGSAPAHATAAYVAPFVVYVGLMGIEHALGLPPRIFYPVRCAASALALIMLSRDVCSWRPSRPLASALLGALVFLIWVAPDWLFDYRHFWLFENALFGKVSSSVPPDLQGSLSFRVVRTLGCTVLVPILEELFWRGWLMRWLIDGRFWKVPLGSFTSLSFWTVAAMFASEHGPYWEVGLAAGVLYNWWMIRTCNLADCIVAHSVTNGLLSLYVLAANQWQYWL